MWYQSLLSIQLPQLLNIRLRFLRVPCQRAFSEPARLFPTQQQWFRPFAQPRHHLNYETGIDLQVHINKTANVLSLATALSNQVFDFLGRNTFSSITAYRNQGNTSIKISLLKGKTNKATVLLEYR